MQELKHTTTYRQILRERIIEVSMALFAKQGVKAVKMDDIAQKLQISKRTLYEIYDNKELLLYEGLRKYHEKSKSEMERYAGDGHNVMEIILEFYRLRVEESHEVEPVFFTDIQKYPKVVTFLQEEHERKHAEFFQFINKGVAEGYFRSDIDYQIFESMMDGMKRYVIENHLYHKYTFEQLFHSIVLVCLRGICTKEGVKILDQHPF